MFQSSVVLLVTALAFVAGDLSSVVPEKCPSTGQAASQCYLNILNAIIQGVTKGRSDLGIEQLDPFLTGPLNLSVSAGADQYRMNFLEPKFAGLNRARFTAIKVGNPLLLTLSVPRLVMSSPYANSGRIILIQASGGGSMTNTFDDAQLSMSFGYGTEEREGRSFATISDSKVKFSSKKSRMHVDRLNSGNAIALELYNVFLSASGDEILKLMLPQFNEKFSIIFKDMGQRIVKNLPLDAVFTKE